MATSGSNYIMHVIFHFNQDVYNKSDAANRALRFSIIIMKDTRKATGDGSMISILELIPTHPVPGSSIKMVSPSFAIIILELYIQEFPRPRKCVEF